ncbi:GNAT family N-acetyltransferase [Taklimakanibacter deserti]|uniref:GNAT family N-acetyltransferase n=1 Tax=Taklimakanibacter deserti TaxID=2267839 RepID=UPI000E65B917
MPNDTLAFTIRPYRPEDRDAVVDLFVRVNRSLAPPEMKEVFEAYVARSLAEEIGQIDRYYDAARDRSFWVTIADSRLLGNFGLEPADDGAAEVRRMYVDFPFRRSGIARAMLLHAETCARQAGFTRLILSTSSLQQPALALYRSSGFELVRQEIANSPSLKTVGNGIPRYHLEKPLIKGPPPNIQASVRLSNPACSP